MDISIPKITTHDIGDSISDPSAWLSAVGRSATIVVKVVIRMGLNLL
jgi:hypothetical protein